MNLNKTRIKQIAIVLLGAVAGYAYYYFIGCASGTCPIQSNPYISTAYGALIAAVFAFPGKKKQQKTEN
jgi:hypothetical protein